MLDVLVALNAIIVIAVPVLYALIIVFFLLFVHHVIIAKLAQVHVLYVMQNVTQIIKYYFYTFLIANFEYLFNKLEKMDYFYNLNSILYYKFDNNH